MNLETKITIYKFAPQVFTLTRFGKRLGVKSFRTRKDVVPFKERA